MSIFNFENSLDFAKLLDEQDELSAFRNQFYFPKKNGTELIYFCGNSLGLQPKTTAATIDNVLEDWASMGVAGHVAGVDPWVTYHLKFQQLLAPLVGALPHEVVAMNSLTANLHLMLATFYKPTKQRFKIITEARNFSSDIYALHSQIKLHGLDPDCVIIEIPTNGGTECIEEQAILDLIAVHQNSLALVMLSSVNYYSGQLLRLPEIAKATHDAGAVIGLDLAHAIGNADMNLHDWNIDFAVWCSYKYLNSGPGAVGGLYVHEQHSSNPELVRPAGWWGNRPEDRFKMNKTFIPSLDADGFQLSNAPVISMAAHYAALQIFQTATIDKVVAKSQQLTGFLTYLMQNNCTLPEAKYQLQIITPLEIDRRGAQLSVEVVRDCKGLFELISEAGFVVDMRSEKVIRIAPAPLYNGFVEVFKFVDFLKKWAKVI